MVNVNPIDGIKYGFRVIGYLVVVYIVGFVLFLAGGLVAQDQLLVGGILLLVGMLTITAGFVGVLYKMIADGVEKGIRAANGDMGGQQGRQQQGRQQQSRQQQGRQQQQYQQNQQQNW